MEKERFIERVKDVRGVTDVLNAVINATADSIGRLEERVFLLEQIATGNEHK